MLVKLPTLGSHRTIRTFCFLPRIVNGTAFGQTYTAWLCFINEHQMYIHNRWITYKTSPVIINGVHAPRL